MGDNELKSRLEAVLGSRAVEASPLPVGFGLTGLKLRLADGRRLAVKARQGGAGRTSGFELEAYMLGELARHSELPVPCPLRRRRPSRHGLHRERRRRHHPERRAARR